LNDYTTDHAKDAKQAVLCHFNLPQRLSKATNGSNFKQPLICTILFTYFKHFPGRTPVSQKNHRVYSTVAGAIAIGHKAAVPCSSQFTLQSLVPTLSHVKVSDE